jgi:hypothetical protein
MPGPSVRRTPSLWRSTGDYAVVASIDGRSAELAGSAVSVWLALPAADEPPVPFDELVAQLAAAHDVLVDEVARDVSSVIGSLEAVGCVVRVE